MIMVKYIFYFLLSLLPNTREEGDNFPPALMIETSNGNIFYLENNDSLYLSENEIIYLDGLNIIPDGETDPDKEYVEAKVVWTNLIWRE